MWKILPTPVVLPAATALVVALAGCGGHHYTGVPGRPITPEEILGIRYLDSDLQLSVDGTQIAFTVREPPDTTKPSDPEASNIWTMAVDGRTPPQQLPSSTGSESSPRWSPDGHSLAFLSPGPGGVDGDPSNQVYSVTTPQKRAIQLTSTSHGTGRFAWAPDGSEIAFITDRGVEFQSVAAPGQRSAPGPLLDVREFVWSPDGRELAITYSPSPDSTALTLAIMDRAARTIVRTLTTQVADIPNQLRWSPDGGWITFAANAPSGLGSWLAMVPARGGAAHGILRDSLLSVWQVEWMLDSKRIIAEVVRGTQAELITVDPWTDTVVKILNVVQSQWGYGFSSKGDLIAFPAQSPRSPDDVWVSTLDGRATQLTTLNPQTATWSLGEVNVVTWRSSVDSLMIHGVLVTPPGYVKGVRYPMIVEGHPGDTPWWPGWLAGWWNWGQLLASRGYVVFLPNYRGVAGQGWRMHERIGDWGGVAYHDLMDGVDEMIRLGIADSTRLGIGGFSNGGFMTEWVITHSQRFDAAVAKSAHSNMSTLYRTSASNRPYLQLAFGGSPDDWPERYQTHSPISFVRQVSTPTLLVYGSDDSVTPSLGEEFYAALKEQAVPSELIIYHDERHGLRSYHNKVDFQRRVIAWFNRYMR